ncbi:hypothetical protein BB561_001637 [Smittium simulii]|uniref:Phosphatidyl-N-methylethanolamine N-methyltransferase n=1 Tax=Smittium simulii TaxID=133385 RepID=A0A2T9YTS4_9FUNG|nr:hypothetical protein BB561_001637 [Smittium simulii]
MLNVTDHHFLLSAASIIFNPLFWNIVARKEYESKLVTNIFGSSKKGCYGLGITIFSLGLLRDYLYKVALMNQPVLYSSTPLLLKVLSFSIIFAGNVLVLSSMYKLGFVGTYLGDYFGFLMDEMITSFPFNVCDHPMYIGSTLSFFGVALYYGSPAGMVLTALVYLCYQVASKYELEFTTKIYSKVTKTKLESSKPKKL